MLRRALTGAVVVLVLFHAWLLTGQAVDGRLVELDVLARWLVAGGIIVAFAQLRRQGASLLFGRKAATIWLLAAWLHGPALAARVDPLGAAMPEAAATLTEIGIAVAAFGLTLWLLGRLGRVSTRRPPAERLAAHLAFVAVPPTRGFDGLAPRPPPHAA